MTKAEIRKFIAARCVDAQLRTKQSGAVIEMLKKSEAFRQAKTIGAYVPLPDEVDISSLFQCDGKQFFIPSFDPEDGIYRLAAYNDHLKKGKFGIPEPADPVFAPAEIDLILVPGIAFDGTGNRLGRGGGFYDRLLPLYRTIRTGLCFDFQRMETIPAEPHDCRMNFVVSESQISQK